MSSASNVQYGIGRNVADVLRKEHGWLVRARWVALIFLALATTGAERLDFIESAWPLYGVCAAAATYNILLLLIGSRLGMRRSITFSLFFDIVALTAFLHYSGDLENPLIFAYSLPVVAGTVILSKRAGFLLAAISIAAVFFLILATLADQFPFRLHHFHLALDPDLKIHESVDPDIGNKGWAYILTNLAVLTAILVGSAHGFGSLSRRIQETEQEVFRQHERMRLLLSIVPEGVALIDRAGTITFANAAAERLVAVKEGTRLDELDPRFGLPAQLDQFVPVSKEFETHLDNRALNHLLAQVAPNEPVVWLIRDRTEQQRLMAQLMHQSKMVDMGFLAAGIAHEIGNPLSSISGILQLIEMKQAAPELADRLRSVSAHVDRIGRIVRDVGSFARPTSDKHSRVSVSDVVNKAAEIFRLHEKSRRIRLSVAMPANSIFISAVEDQIVQVILNLLLNAADASKGEGAIEISAERGKSDVRLAILDRGSGMSQPEQDHLFTPFFTTKEPGRGVGLGLFISESIVQSHGGRIEVRSAKGKGSTFTVCMPVME
ncbi:MAG: PAS domain-containing protein [Planctomycetes bacterium]|nr:PAS domain-containing protein [Planctomycetota bacterium]MBI3834516.1 PAS domain-containing protein [Planctomycetota bacterium]